MAEIITSHTLQTKGSKDDFRYG
ncbi:juvenile hormone binding protein an-0128 precursor, partial [Danaus plexippus plexippus]